MAAVLRDSRTSSQWQSWRQSRWASSSPVDWSSGTHSGNPAMAIDDPNSRAILGPGRSRRAQRPPRLANPFDPDSERDLPEAVATTLSSNVAQSYPYTTETEAERAPTIEALDRAVRRPARQDRGRERAARLRRSGGARPAQSDRGSSCVPSTSRPGSTLPVMPASATPCSRCATRAAKPTSADASTSMADDGGDGAGRVRAGLITCRQCGNDVPRLEFCIRCGDPLDDEYNAETPAPAAPPLRRSARRAARHGRPEHPLPAAAAGRDALLPDRARRRRGDRRGARRCSASSRWRSSRRPCSCRR